MVYRHEKCVGEVSFHFQLVLNTVGVLSHTTDTNFKGERLDEHEGCRVQLKCDGTW